MSLQQYHRGLGLRAKHFNSNYTGLRYVMSKI